MVEGKEVRLEFDWQRRDKYGRLLAYVYLPDGTFLNAELIKQGYGFASMTENNGWNWRNLLYSIA
jgi:micrococcal nuclease